MRYRIAIGIHQKDFYPFRKSHLIWYLREIWEKEGHEVQIIRGRKNVRDRFDLFIPHIDLTKVPTKYTQFLKTRQNAINQKLTDISKRNISKNLITNIDGFQGPVIVKSDANYGGQPELKNAPLTELFKGTLNTLMGNPNKRRISPSDYKVYDSVLEIPEHIWENKFLVVEKFIPEIVNGKYCIRICFFLGNKTINTRVHSSAKIIKGEKIERVEFVDIPDGLFDIRNELGIDYGKIDYVIQEGKVHVLDVSKTPGIIEDKEVNRNIAKKLVNGIHDLIPNK